MKNSQIRNHKKLPTFIKDNPIFVDDNEISKIFPSLGLVNCSKKVSALNHVQGIAKKIIENITNKQQSWNQSASANIKNALRDGYAYEAAPYQKQLAEGCKRLKVIKSLNYKDFIKNKQLSIPKKLGSVAKLNKSYNDYKQEDQDVYDNYTKYSIFGICGIHSNMKIVFSSNKLKGIYDIATMSMRGTPSCQSWNGDYRSQLVGSMVDPCLGIIYITDNIKTKYGERMLYRALVRYIINPTTKQEYLLLENIYSRDAMKNKFQDNYIEVFALFKKFLESKLKNKNIKIISGAKDRTIYMHCHIPKAGIIHALDSWSELSYRDSEIKYSNTIVNLIK